jgi:thiosulfate/3-mercaptopyruvate sulfurtransferase
MTGWTTLITVAELHRLLSSPDLAIFDCRFDLTQPSAGKQAYLQEHIPGAVYADIERDLSAPPDGVNGRHPLPPAPILAAVFSRWGIGPRAQVVAYDDNGGGYAARLWWSLRWLGHRNVAVLDGGLQAWTRAGHRLVSGSDTRPPSDFVPRQQEGMQADTDEILGRLGAPDFVLLDSRAPERYRGDEEPIDPVAGHIPGAHNLFWQGNLDVLGQFLPVHDLQARFTRLLGLAGEKSAVIYCGSGVTACHNLLAMTHAGLVGARLYLGGWSAWCADATRPVATGPEAGGPPSGET